MEMAPFGSEAARDPFADALRRARHKDRFAVQSQIHVRLRSFRDANLAYNIAVILAK
jgi:hypothetical protein